jgi:hypothetical protein
MKYVIVHQLVGQWEQGTVVDGALLPPEAWARLLDLGAVSGIVEEVVEEVEATPMKGKAKAKTPETTAPTTPAEGDPTPAAPSAGDEEPTA